MKLVLILTVSFCFSLMQSASAERWRGLIASVAAFESAKVKYQTECVGESCLLKLNEAPKADKLNDYIFRPVFEADSIEEVVEKSETSPVMTTKTYTRRRFQLFGRGCLSCR